MFGIDDLVLGGLAAGGKLLSGFGAMQSAGKANRNAVLLANTVNANRSALATEIYQKFGTPQSIVTNANAAGFNPVTWLNSAAGGGLMAEAVMKSYDLRQLQMPDLQAKPSALQAWGSAVSAGAESLQQSSEAADKLAQQQENVDKYIKAVTEARSKGNAMAGLGTPAFSTAARSPVTGGGAAAALSMPADIGVKDKFEFSNVMPGGGIDTNFPDAMGVERRYGFFPAQAQGGVNLLADGYRRNFNPLGADPAKDYGFGTRFNPNAANDRVAPPRDWWSGAADFQLPAIPSAGSTWTPNYD